MEAIIKKISRGHYKWQVGHVYSSTCTRWGAIRQAKKQAKSDVQYKKQKTEIIDIKIKGEQ